MKILFICHGNICRSTMAEFVLKDLAYKHKLNWVINSCGTSAEELGNDTHPETKLILDRYHIPYTKRHARQLKKEDYKNYDLLICMDKKNLQNTLRIVESDPDNKVRLLLNRDIADPWYTYNYEDTYFDVSKGCNDLISTYKQ